MEITGYTVYCLVLLLSHLVQGITGFGGIVLALPVLVYFFPVKTLIPALVVVNLVQTMWFTVSERRHIQPGHAKSIVFLSLAGLPFGYAAYRFLPSEQLKVGLGIFVIIVAVWNLNGLTLKRRAPLFYYHFLPISPSCFFY